MCFYESSIIEYSHLEGGGGGVGGGFSLVLIMTETTNFSYLCLENAFIPTS